MAKAGAVWLPVLPDFSLFNKTSATELKLTMGKAGKTSGATYGRAFAASTKMSMAGMKQAIVAETAAATAQAEKIVRASSARLGAARKAEADAVGALNVAETQLNDLRAREAGRAAALEKAEAHLGELRKADAGSARELAAAEGRVNSLRAKGSANATALVGAEERVAKAHRGEALAADRAKAAAGELATAQADAAAVSTGAAAESTAASGTLGRFATQGSAAFGKVGGAAKNMLKTTGKLGLGLGAFGLAEFAAHGVKAAGDFQKSMTLLVTAGGESKKALGLVGDGVMHLATQTGTSTDQLAEGMYTIEKAGFRGANGLKILKASAQGAKAENVDLSVMTNAVTSAMTSYHLKAGDANKVTNEMVAAAGAAKTNMQTFAGSLSTVLPIASAAGISFAQVGGAIATLTNHGTSAEEATQELSNTIRNLQAPNNVAVNEMGRFGIRATDVASKLGKRGLTGTLEFLSETVLRRMGPSGLVLLKTFNQSKTAGEDARRMFAALPPAAAKVAKGYTSGALTLKDYRLALKGLSAPQAALVGQYVVTENRAKGFDQSLRNGVAGSKTYVSAIKSMTGGANGLNTTLQLTGENTGRFNANVKAVTKAAKEGGGNVSTWAATQKTFNVQLDQFKQGIAVAGIKLGTVLIPKLITAGHYIADTLVPAVVNAYKKGFKPLFDFISAHSGVFKIVAAAILIGVAAIEAYTYAIGINTIVTAIAAGKQAAFAEATLGQKVIILGIAAATKVWAAAQWIFNAAMDGNPLVLITLAIIALGVALVIAYKKSATFRAIVQGALHGVLAVAQAVAGAFITAWNAVVGFFIHTIPNAVMSVIRFFRSHWKLIAEIVLASLGPIGLIGALLLKFWGPISGAFITAFHAIASAAKATWGVVTAVIRVAWTVLKDIGKVIYIVIALPFYVAFRAIRAITRLVWGWIGPYVMAAIHGVSRGISAAMRAVRSAWSAAWNAVKSVARTVWNAIAGFFATAWGLFASFLRRAWTTWVRIAHAAWNTLAGPVKAVWNTLSGWFSAAWGAFSGFVSRRWHNFVTSIRIIWGGIIGPIKAVWRTVSGWLTQTWRAFSKVVGRVWSGIAGKISAAFSGVAGGVKAVWKSISGAFTSAVNAIINDVINPFLKFISGIPGVNIKPLGTLGGGKGGGKGRGAVSSGAAKGLGPLGNGVLRNATGGNVRPGQRSWVGERGPEIMEALAGGGVRIYPHGKSMQMAGTVGAGQRGYSIGGFFGGIADAAQYAGGKVWSGTKAVGAGARELAVAGVKAILHGAESAANSAISVLPGGHFIRDLAHGIVGKIVNGIENWVGGKGHKPAASGGMPSATGATGSALAIGKKLAASMGWNGAQWQALVSLWNGESGWRVGADNPSSSAYGIPQALPGSKMASAGADWRTNPETQERWGMGYIASRYGNPLNAYNTWLGRSPHWYDSGGVLKPGTTLVHNGTGKPEAILTAKQWGMLYQAILDKKRNDKLKEFGYGVTLAGLTRAGKAVAGSIANGMTANSSVARIRQAAGTIATQIKDVFGGSRRDSLLSYVKDVTGKIATLAGQRDAINAQLTAARSLRETVSGNVGAGSALTGITAGRTKGLIAGMKKVYEQVKAFGANVKTAAGKGLSASLINQLTGEGYETGGDLAKLLAHSSKADIRKLSQIQGAINFQSGKVGDTVVNAEMGGTVARSFVDGLNRQKGALDRQMDALARRFANTMAHQLATPASLKAMGVTKAELIAAKAKKYDTGGALHPGLTLAYNATGRTEHVLTDAQLAQRTGGGNGTGGGAFTGTLHLSTGEFLGVIDGRIDSNTKAQGSMLAAGRKRR